MSQLKRGRQCALGMQELLSVVVPGSDHPQSMLLYRTVSHRIVSYQQDGGCKRSQAPVSDLTTRVGAGERGPFYFTYFKYLKYM